MIDNPPVIEEESFHVYIIGSSIWEQYKRMRSNQSYDFAVQMKEYHNVSSKIKQCY